MDEDLSGPCPAPNGTAILHYANSVLSVPNTELPNNEIPVELDWINLSPIPAAIAPSPVAQEFTLNVIFLPDENNVTLPYINGINWEPLNGTNTLFEILNGVQTSSFPVSHHVVEADGGKVVQVILNNYDTGEHPFHLHGYYFSVLGRGTDGPYNATLHEASLKTLNPIRREVISVQAGGWIVLRFLANNPGPWIFHCHIVPHLYAGLAMIFNTDPQGLIQNYPGGTAAIPATLDDFCSNLFQSFPPPPPPPSFNSTTGGGRGPAGSSTSTTGGGVHSSAPVCLAKLWLLGASLFFTFTILAY